MKVHYVEAEDEDGEPPLAFFFVLKDATTFAEDNGPGYVVVTRTLFLDQPPLKGHNE